MNALQFEAAHRADWQALADALAAYDVRGSKKPVAKPEAGDPARLTTLYRRACEHLALAQARAYPLALIQRLEALTAHAHQVIYRPRNNGWAAFKRLFLIDFPQAVRDQRLYVWIALLAFAVPLIGAGVQAYRDPGFILSIEDAATVQGFDQMYGNNETPLGSRTAERDWVMFGFYIMNNIGIAFRCFASGLLAGVGSLFALVLNGLSIGAVAGYLTWRGHGLNFWSFVSTHGAFELTAIVLSGACGLMLGHALLAPGRRTRAQALREAASRAVPIVYGMFAMLVIAAAVEAFWSSSRWIEPHVKFIAAGLCWCGVLAYLFWQGRPR